MSCKDCSQVYLIEYRSRGVEAYCSPTCRQSGDVSHDIGSSVSDFWQARSLRRSFISWQRNFRGRPEQRPAGAPRPSSAVFDRGRKPHIAPEAVSRRASSSDSRSSFTASTSRAVQVLPKAVSSESHPWQLPFQRWAWKEHITLFIVSCIQVKSKSCLRMETIWRALPVFRLVEPRNLQTTEACLLLSNLTFEHPKQNSMASMFS